MRFIKCIYTISYLNINVVSVIMLQRCVVFWVLTLQVWGANYDFPDNFKFGASTAAFQIEGAWNVSDKSPSMWDNYLHQNESWDNGDVTCDSYHLWERDVEIASELGLHFYRFSISWTRLLPSGFSNHISEDGRRYYDNLINGLLEKGIEPMITLYHWDMPQNLQDLGGWTNPLMADWFAEYARVVYSLFSDRVKLWVTINEPYTICIAGYVYGIHPPSVSRPGIAEYLCVKNILVAHARAWRIYDKEFRPKYNGEVSISNHLVWMEAHNDDEETAELFRQFFAGLFSHAIYSKEGGWPPAVEQLVAQNSLSEGYPRSRLPSFTTSEIELVKGTYDFYALNHYTCRVVRRTGPGEKPTNTLGTVEMSAILEPRPEWKKAATSWFYIYYEGLRKQLLWLKQNYGDIKIVITESGYASSGLNLNDQDRIEYTAEILKQILLSIHEDGVSVVGYTAWSLVDNLEWNDGYQPKFGLYQVDFKDPELKRIPRASAKFYADLIENHSLNISRLPLFNV